MSVNLDEASGEHWSSCAVNNAPALPVGPCDCGGLDPAIEYMDDRVTGVVAATGREGALVADEAA
jgi:hypothetical protein